MAPIVQSSSSIATIMQKPIRRMKKIDSIDSMVEEALANIGELQGRLGNACITIWLGIHPMFKELSGERNEMIPEII